MLRKALLVLERPWWTPEESPRRPSVLPFLQGLEKIIGKFNIYYSNFYEAEGFKRALEDDLTNTKEDRLFLYIAAHGRGKMVGGTLYYTGIKLSTMLTKLREVAGYKNLEGLVIGSCEIGGNVDYLMQTMINSNLRWIFGYTCEIDWMPSMMIDMAVLEHLMGLSKNNLNDKNKIINAFVRALKRFDGQYLICKDEHVRLRDAISLVVQPLGKGKKPLDETESLIEKLKWSE